MSLASHCVRVGTALHIQHKREASTLHTLEYQLPWDSGFTLLAEVTSGLMHMFAKVQSQIKHFQVTWKALLHRFGLGVANVKVPTCAAHSSFRQHLDRRQVTRQSSWYNKISESLDLQCSYWRDPRNRACCETVYLCGSGVTDISGEPRRCSHEWITVDTARSWVAASIKNVMQLEKQTGPGSHGGLLF